MKNKFILDVTCSSKMFWFNKKHPNTIYIDNRKLKDTLVDGRKLEINPDIIMDFRDLKFKDKSFKLVVFDPPHLLHLGKKSWMAKKYGILEKTWRKDLRKGFDECWRVLEDYGVLIFKWNEDQISFKEVLNLFPIQPLFGHPTARSGKTKWFTFMKIPESSQ